MPRMKKPAFTKMLSNHSSGDTINTHITAPSVTMTLSYSHLTSA